MEPKITKKRVCVGLLSTSKSELKVVIFAEHWPSWYHTSMGLGWRVAGICVKHAEGLEKAWGSELTQSWVR